VQKRVSLPCGHGLQSVQSCFTLPWGQGLHSAQARFRLPRGHGLQSAQACFSLPCEHRLRSLIMHLRARLGLRSGATTGEDRSLALRCSFVSFVPRKIKKKSILSRYAVEVREAETV
jgi:hypothetical protein